MYSCSYSYTTTKCSGGGGGGGGGGEGVSGEVSLAGHALSQVVHMAMERENISEKKLHC